MSWFLIECLGQDGMSIVAVDGERRDWASVLRLNRMTGNGQIVNKLYELRKTGKPFTTAFEGTAGWWLFGVVPILGLDDDVYGMQVWLSSSGEEASSPRPAAGVRWNVDDWQVHQRLESWLMSSDDAKAFEDVRSPGKFFRKVMRLDKFDQLAQMAMHPSAESRIDGDLTVLHDNGTPMHWLIFSRGRDDEQHRGQCGLTYDVTDVDPPTCGARVALTMKLHATEDGDAAALLVFPASGPPLIAQWVPPIPRWIDWRRQGDTELIHPDDWSVLRRTNTLLGPDE